MIHSEWCPTPKLLLMAQPTKHPSPMSQFSCPSTVLKREPKAVDIMDKFMLLIWVQNWKWHFHFLACVRVRGSRTLQFAPLLHHQPTFDDNKFHQLRRSNFPSFKNIIVCCRKQIPSIITLSRDHNNHYHLRKQNKLPSLQIIKQVHNTYKRYRMFSCLSHSVAFKCLRPRPSTPQARPYTWRLRMEAG